jgi:hypothetical protein
VRRDFRHRIRQRIFRSGTCHRERRIPQHKHRRGCVIGERGVFLVVARNFKDFARAIRRKLMMEIAGKMP